MNRRATKTIRTSWLIAGLVGMMASAGLACEGEMPVEVDPDAEVSDEEDADETATEEDEVKEDSEVDEDTEVDEEVVNEHNPDALFAEGWGDEYVEVQGCSQTKHPTGGNVQVWLSPDGQAAFEAGETLPEGAIFLKPIWLDETGDCTTSPDVFTVMKSDGAGEWDWQMVGGDGSIGEDFDPAGCIGCHTACSDSMQCTNP